MRTTIDAAGRIVVPKKIRVAAQLDAGTELEVSVEDGRIQLQPVAPPTKLEKRGHLLVATRPKGAGVLTQEMVEATLEAVRSERGRSAPGKRRRP